MSSEDKSSVEDRKEDIPLSKGALIGCRLWDLTYDNRLESIGFGRQVWDKVMSASCKNNSNHSAPVEGCECGLYSYYLNRYRSNDAFLGWTVQGIVVGKGNVQIHEEGFRASKMQILALIDKNIQGEISSKKISEIASSYKIPTLKSSYEVFKFVQSLVNSGIGVLEENDKLDAPKEFYPFQSIDPKTGLFHSYEDQPSSIDFYGNSEWHYQGHLHREGGPASISSGGREKWYQYGKLHRENEPAIISPDGLREWWLNGVNYRPGDLPASISNGGQKTWKNNEGVVHRDEDLPAVADSTGYRAWYQNGKIHRDNGPAKIIRDAEGQHQEWYINGNCHRSNDLPASIRSDGTEVWYFKGDKHREGDLPALVGPDRQEWYCKDLLHRDNDLPAVIMKDGYQAWYKDGYRSRPWNKPAIVYADGSKEWWYEGDFIRSESADGKDTTEEKRQKILDEIPF